MTQKSIHLSLETIQGFLDADGSFEAKVYEGTQKPISFYVNIIFTQKHKNVLKAILTSMNIVNSKGCSTKKISERQIKNISGTISTAYSITISFEIAKELREFYQNNPPKAPTKLRDFRIVEILAKTKEFKACEVINRHLPDTSIQNERIAALALLWLRYSMFGKIKKTRNPKLLPIERYYSNLQATPEEIQQSVDIGQRLLAPICREIEAFTEGSQVISNDYLLGYHIGDGSFQIQTFFEKPKSFKAKFTWTLTDCTENLALLKAIKQQLESEGISCIINNYKTWYRLKVYNIGDCKILVDKWRNQKMPSVRQNQYDCFVEALELYSSNDFRQDLEKLKRFINLKWAMNPGTTRQRKGNKKEDIKKVTFYFKNRD